MKIELAMQVSRKTPIDFLQHSVTIVTTIAIFNQPLGVHVVILWYKSNGCDA